VSPVEFLASVLQARIPRDFKERVAMKYGVVGVNVYARKPC